MSKSKKFVSAVLMTTTAVWMSGATLLIPIAQAQTTADLQAQIAGLLAQIAQLQIQLGGGSSAGTVATTFTQDLTVGSRGTQVSALQQILISGGYLTAVTAPTGYFGLATKAAVTKWFPTTSFPTKFPRARPTTGPSSAATARARSP